MNNRILVGVRWINVIEHTTHRGCYGVRLQHYRGLRLVTQRATLRTLVTTTTAIHIMVGYLTY